MHEISFVFFIHKQGIFEDSHFKKTIKLLLLVSFCVSLSCSRKCVHDTRECGSVCLRMWWIMFSWVGGVGFWVCFVRHEMDFASHSCHKNQNKSSSAFSVTDTFVFLCKQTVRVQREKMAKHDEWRIIVNILDELLLQMSYKHKACIKIKL